ncbi:MAG: DciA family protein [Gallionella sp.]
MSQPIKNLLNRQPEFRAILDKSTYLSTLQRHFVATAPSYLAQGCQVSGLTFGILNVVTGNATLAAKLRQLAPDIAAKMRQKGCEVNGIQVKVQVSYLPPPIPSVPRILTPVAHQALATLNQSLADSPLKSAVAKMLDQQMKK